MTVGTGIDPEALNALLTMVKLLTNESSPFLWSTLG
jgi:hypothetical protein